MEAAPPAPPAIPAPPAPPAQPAHSCSSRYPSHRPQPSHTLPQILPPPSLGWYQDPSSSRSRRSRPRTPPKGNHDWHEAGNRSRGHGAYSTEPNPPTQHAQGEAEGLEEGDVGRADDDAESNSQSSATKRLLLPGDNPPRRQAPDERPSPGSAQAQAVQQGLAHPGTHGRRQATNRPRRPKSCGCAGGRTTNTKRSQHQPQPPRGPERQTRPPERSSSVKRPPSEGPPLHQP